MNNIKINLGLALLLSKTKKQFIFFNVENNKIINYKLTNDIIRDKKKYNYFRVISTIKIENKILN